MTHEDLMDIPRPREQVEGDQVFKARSEDLHVSPALSSMTAAYLREEEAKGRERVLGTDPLHWAWALAQDEAAIKAGKELVHAAWEEPGDAGTMLRLSCRTWIGPSALYTEKEAAITCKRCRLVVLREVPPAPRFIGWDPHLPGSERTVVVTARRDLEKGQVVTVKDIRPTHPHIPCSPVVAPSNEVEHPPHYGGADNPYEVIKVMEAWGFDKNAYLFNVVTYVARADKKGTPLKDLKKARWYLDREIKNREATEAAHNKEQKS